MAQTCQMNLQSQGLNELSPICGLKNWLSVSPETKGIIIISRGLPLQGLARTLSFEIYVWDSW